MFSSDESDDGYASPGVRSSDSALEKALRDMVASIYEAGDMQELTVRRVRLATEKRLGLDEGFFKNDSRWKAKSDEIIKDEVVSLSVFLQGLTGRLHAAHLDMLQKVQEQALRQGLDRGEGLDQTLPKTVKSSESKSEAARAPKRRRMNVIAESDEESAFEESFTVSNDDSEKHSRLKAGFSKRASTPTAQGSAIQEKSPSKDESNVDSDSDLSVVLDEAPPKSSNKRQRSASGAAQSRKKKQKTAAARDLKLEPDQEEIKRLQRWLVKCGIRKMWFRELAPFETSLAKIKHLKGMLKDAGMEGRYSEEKARRIREARELKADLEFVQEGAKKWGVDISEAEQSDAANRSRRRLHKPRQTLAFLDDDGEETD